MTDCFLHLRTEEPVSKIANILGLLTRVNNLMRVNLKRRFNFSCLKSCWIVGLEACSPTGGF